MARCRSKSEIALVRVSEVDGKEVRMLGWIRNSGPWTGIYERPL